MILIFGGGGGDYLGFGFHESGKCHEIGLSVEVA